MPDREVIDQLIDDISRTRGIRHAACVKGQLFAEGCMSLTEMKPGRLSLRLIARRRGDRVSELFYDHLSTEGRAILLRILRNRT